MVKKKVPQFANEDEERAFWSEHDSTEYLDWSQARRASAPNLRPTPPMPNEGRDLPRKS